MYTSLPLLEHLKQEMRDYRAALLEDFRTDRHSIELRRSELLEAAAEAQQMKDECGRLMEANARHVLVVRYWRVADGLAEFRCLCLKR